MTERYHVWDLPAEPGGEVTLDADESHHFLRVMRGRPGDVVEIFGNGNLFSAEVTACGKNHPVQCRLTARLLSTAPLPVSITCAIPWIRGGKSERVVRQLTEMGVEEMILFPSQRETAHGGEEKLARLRRVAVEACKQCRRDAVPVIHEVSRLDEAVAAFDGLPAQKLLLYENEQGNRFSDFAGKALAIPPGRVLIITGPEGGFDPSEIDSLGGETSIVSLGPLILRAETAPVASAAAILALAGWF